LNEEEKQEILDKYYEDVAWLRAHISPDDVYDFCTQLRMALRFFFGRLIDEIDIDEETKLDAMLNQYTKNFLGLELMQISGSETMINAEFKIEEI